MAQSMRPAARRVVLHPKASLATERMGGIAAPPMENPRTVMASAMPRLRINQRQVAVMEVESNPPMIGGESTSRITRKYVR